MVPVRGELLFPTRVLRLGIRAAYVAANNLRRLAQFSERPFHVRDLEAAIFPVRRGIFRAQAIEIDCDVDVFIAKTCCERFELPTPVFAQERAAFLSIFAWTIVRPWMHFECASALRTAVSQNVVWPPTFETPTTPDRNMLHLLDLERAIDPTTARPFRRRDRPIGMIVEGNEDEGLKDATNQQSAQIMKVAGAVERERSESRFEFAKKSFYNARRSRKAQVWSPLAGINDRNID